MKITAYFTEDNEDILQSLMAKINSSCYSKGHISPVAISFLLCVLECLLNR